LAESDIIGVAEFPQIVSLVSRDAAQGAHRVDSAPISPQMEPTLTDDSLAQDGKVSPRSALSPDLLPLLDEQGEVRRLEDVESDVIRFAIAHYRGQMSEVARRLQIGRSTLYRKLDALGPAQPMGDQDTDPVVAG
jgi:DNA-binding NtrC family response regulator